ncbi:DDE Tnp4 domain-containing protein [Trichonephila clavipes]|nr:DDE Tnp4 domain-containing protein [Trichonephila clavipes]
MLDLMKKPNYLQQTVEENDWAKKRVICILLSDFDLPDFLRLTWKELRHLILGIYKLKQSRSYTHERLNQSALYSLYVNREDSSVVRLQLSCQVIYSQFGLAIHPNDHKARRRFVEWAQNQIAVVTDFHKRILFSDEAHFWLNGYVNKQNCRIWSEANPQVYVEAPLHPEKLTVWCALWAGGILLPKR